MSEEPDQAGQSSQVVCPSCGTMLIVPRGCSSRVAKCGHCRQKFWLPRQLAVTEEAVVQWIGERDLDEDSDSAPLEGPHDDQPRSIPHTHPSHASPHDTLVAAPAGGDIRVVRCDSRGVLLKFPSNRLKDDAFRCAMPRLCMQCGARSHLEAHVIIYSGALVDSVSLEAEHSAGKMVLGTDEVKDLRGQELLDRLPRVPNVPRPADMPMPYWLCDMCSTAKALSGQIQINSETGEGPCRLLIRNLRRGEEFLSAIGARSTACHRELVRHITATAENPWDLLALAVQHRIQQWFKPAHGESFLAYVPDRDRARTEDGMNGLLVSDRRLIRHGRMRHHEWEVAAPINLILEAGRHKGRLRVTINPDAVHVAVDSEGVAKLRRALTKGRFRAAWR